MPLYQYQCTCGLRFKSSASPSNASKPKPCPDCGLSANRLPPKTVSGHFQKNVTGPVPQNTGIHNLDTHIDRVIGQSAKQGHTVIEARQRRKKQILENNPQVSGFDLSRNLDGSYRVLSSKERGVHDRANKINSLAMQTLKPKSD